MARDSATQLVEEPVGSLTRHGPVEWRGGAVGAYGQRSVSHGGTASAPSRREIIPLDDGSRSMARPRCANRTGRGVRRAPAALAQHGEAKRPARMATLLAT